MGKRCSPRSSNSRPARPNPAIPPLVRRIRARTDILKRLTEAFPEDGSVTAKTVEIRDLNTVTCTGIARDRQVLLKTIENLRKVQQFREVALGPTRGQSPAVQFTFNFQWNEGGRNAN